MDSNYNSVPKSKQATWQSLGLEPGDRYLVTQISVKPWVKYQRIPYGRLFGAHHEFFLKEGGIHLGLLVSESYSQ